MMASNINPNPRFVRPSGKPTAAPNGNPNARYGAYCFFALPGHRTMAEVLRDEAESEQRRKLQREIRAG
jgi:hypothetical protein